MEIYLFVFIFILGTIVGSFLSALTYRLPRGEDMVFDRSKCDRCGRKIEWFDNIPVLSFLILGGKCRNCKKKISIRYPAIELSTALIFVSIISYVGSAGVSTGIYYLLIATFLIAIFVIDLEHQIIPDELVFLLFSIVFTWNLLFFPQLFFQFLFVGFGCSFFLLLINLLTSGKGMGLGDVKFALFAGFMLGYPLAIKWLLLSFIIGALVGLLFVFAGKAKFGKHIAFGPFLIISLFIVLLLEDKLNNYLFPYIF